MNRFVVSFLLETDCPICDAGQVSAAIQTTIVRLLDDGNVLAVVHPPSIADMTTGKTLYPKEGGAR